MGESGFYLVSLLQQHRTFEHEWVEIWAIWISLSYRIAPENTLTDAEDFVYSMLDLEYEKAGVISKRGKPEQNRPSVRPMYAWCTKFCDDSRAERA